MKKYAIILICFLFVLMSCASKPAPAREDSPQIELVISGVSVMVTCTYSGDNWLFIEGVEFRNASGETRKAMFKKPSRSVFSGGRVFESGLFSFAYGDEFLEWLGEGAEVRPLCRYPLEFKPLEIKRK